MLLGHHILVTDLRRVDSFHVVVREQFETETQNCEHDPADIVSDTRDEANSTFKPCYNVHKNEKLNIPQSSHLS